MTVWNHFFTAQMADKIATHNERTLVPMARHSMYAEVAGESLLNLTSNDYLALGSNADLQQQFLNQLSEQALYLSSSSSQLLTGHSPLHQQVELQLAKMFGREAALTFASGYQMNMGLLASLADNRTLILADKYIHASMVDGLLLSKAKFVRYRHNDMAHLHALLSKHHSAYERIIIVTDSLFSMDGDIADLKQLVAFKREFSNVALYVDEAHAIGARGNRGLGCAEEQDCLHDIDFLVGTFGKALHSVGGYIVCTDLVRQYLINHMRPLIFSTALPPLNMAWTLYVLQRLAYMQGYRTHLTAISQQVITVARERYQDCPSDSHIIPIITGDNASALERAQHLRQHGMLAMAVRPPTVPVNQARVRLSLNAALSQDQVAKLISLL